MRSALALNRQPMARPAGVPTIDFVGAGIGPQGRAAAEAVNAQALGRLQGGGATFDPIAAAPSFALTSSASLPKASTFEKLAGLLGLGLTAAGAVGKEYNKTRGGTT
jgi:hypothetical protein